MRELSIIIPALNEAQCLPTVVAELRSVLNMEVHEIIVVDGNSSDETCMVAQNLGCKVLVQNSTGYGAAVTEGLAHAKGDLVTFFDADGSYDPRYLLEAIELLRADGLDAVFCTRYGPNSESLDDTWIRRAGNAFFSHAMRYLFDVKLSDALHLYVVVKTSVARSALPKSIGFEWCMEFPVRIHRQGYRYTEIDSIERRRIAGESKVRALADGLRIARWMIGAWRR